MNNSCYGKTLESKRNRVNLKLVKTRNFILKNSDKILLKSVNMLDANLVAHQVAEDNYTGKRQLSWTLA